jgi:hypothetical protein
LTQTHDRPSHHARVSHRPVRPVELENSSLRTVGVVGDASVRRNGLDPCPGPKPPFLAVKRPARPYKSAIQHRSTVEHAEAFPSS